MKKISLALLAITTLLGSFTSSAALISNITLSSYIQRGAIQNDVSSSAAITSIIYDLGTAADGIATWDNNTAGGTASNGLNNSNYFQTVTWSGLNILAGDTFNFASLDIDLIRSLSPLNVTGGQLDNNGSSLVNASITVIWSDGSTGTTALTQQAWSATQNLVVTAASQVPAPTGIALLGLSLFGLLATRKSK